MTSQPNENVSVVAPPTLDLTHIYDVNDILPYETPVELRPSSVCAGKGLFATADIQKGAVVSHFPCSCILHMDPKEGKANILGFPGYTPWTTEYKTLLDYSFTLTNNAHNGSYYQVSDPTTPFQPHLAAHYINDAVKGSTVLAKVATADATVRAWYKYMTETRKYMNACIHKNDNDFVKVVAIRDIKKDEEILVSYGFPYWVRIPNHRLTQRLRESKEKKKLMKLLDTCNIAKTYI